jgi:hypothetical protein
MPTRPGTKEREIMDFLHERVFGPVLNSDQASDELKRGVRLTIVRMEYLLHQEIYMSRRIPE